MERMGQATGRARTLAHDSARRTIARLEELGVDLEQTVSPWLKGPEWGHKLGQSKQFAADASEPGGRGWFARKPIGRFSGMTEEDVREGLASGLIMPGKVHRRYALTLRGAIELVPYLETPKFETRRAAVELQRVRRRARLEADERTSPLELEAGPPSIMPELGLEELELEPLDEEAEARSLERYVERSSESVWHASRPEDLPRARRVLARLPEHLRSRVTLCEIVPFDPARHERERAELAASLAAEAGGQS